MTNAELIKAMRYCAKHEGCDYYIAKDCPREDTWVSGADCEQILMLDAADALEALLKERTKMIEGAKETAKVYAKFYEKYNELEAQLPKRGEWIQMNGHRYCNVCGHKDSPILTNYCPNCGADMRGEHDEH